MQSTRKIKGTLTVRFPDKPDSTGATRIQKANLKSSNTSYELHLSADIQLISSTICDSEGTKGKKGDLVHVDGVVEGSPFEARKYSFVFYLDYDPLFGKPGAFSIKNLMQKEFFLTSLTLEGVPEENGSGTFQFPCNSWIYNKDNYKTDRIFFTNDTSVPSNRPTPLKEYIQLELETLRGENVVEGKERKRWERIYDYDVYNDLGDPDHNKARPTAGGLAQPYPRRGRTGRPPTNKDSECESRTGYVYVPRDEDLGNLEFSGFLAKLGSISKDTQTKDVEFESFQDVYDMYKKMKDKDDIPLPKIIADNTYAWNSDEEFAREVVAGVNPGLICCLQEYPPKSKLDSSKYGDHTTTIKPDHIEPYMDGSTVKTAIEAKKLFVLDHHDTIFPYLRKINSTSCKGYASRTIFFLKSDGTLKPVAIELSLPRDNGHDQCGPVSSVYLPTIKGSENPLWPLAKAYVVVNDSCFHQLISHWLHTHAVIEPFIIATHRRLSVVHPIYKLLHPHYRNTMNINAAARNSLINADGIIEHTFLWGEIAVEMSSEIYKDWVFPDQALPKDLVNRGMAELPDGNDPSDVKLVMTDYPYANDGLEIWGAIYNWVEEYVAIYYGTDRTVRDDPELKSWWTEIVEKGHGDKKDEKWWGKMKTRQELIDSCTIIIWIASALHAAVNFGQYPYGGLILNRPSLSRRYMPNSYCDAKENPELAYLKTITPKSLALADLLTLDILSKHTEDEQYLGQRDSDDPWTSDTEAINAFDNFGKALNKIQKSIEKKNNDVTLKNRVGKVKMPYTLLYPKGEPGISFKGVPNSISI